MIPSAHKLEYTVGYSVYFPLICIFNNLFTCEKLTNCHLNKCLYFTGLFFKSSSNYYLKYIIYYILCKINVISAVFIHVLLLSLN